MIERIAYLQPLILYVSVDIKGVAFLVFPEPAVFEKPSDPISPTENEHPTESAKRDSEGPAVDGPQDHDDTTQQG
jgi:hypothetical protein